LKDEVTAKRGGVGEMRKRCTTLEDGRYLIYYTFGGERGAARESEGGEPKREPEAEAEAEEGRRV
jgi:hypothetical protein